MRNWKETPPSNCEVRSAVYFLTTENNSGAKIHRSLWTAHEERNVMKIRNIQQRQLIFQEEKTYTVTSTKSDPAQC